MEVIGAGFGRTGTLSLRAALEELGYGPCYHMLELMDHPEHAKLWSAARKGRLSHWDQLLGGYRATVDWPGAYFWHELMQTYPDAKVILTVRDPQRWFESASTTIFQASNGGGPLGKLAMFAAMARRPDRLRIMGVIRGVLINGTFNGNTKDAAHAIGVFDRHVEQVKRTVPAERLLVYELRQGWEPLCEFLGVDVPDTPLPHLNDSADFNSTIGKDIHRRMLRDAAPVGAALVGAVLFGLVAVARNRRRPRD